MNELRLPSTERSSGPPLPLGEGRGEGLFDFFQYGSLLLQDFVVPEAENRDAFAGKIVRPRGVLSLGLGLVVLSAVYFDRQTCFVAVEVQDEWRNRVLPAELETVEPSVTQQSPEP